MKRLLLLLWLLPVCLFAKAQANSLADSLHNQLVHSTTVADRIYWLNRLARNYTGIDTTKAEEFSSQLLAVADSSRNRELMIKSLLYEAERLYDFGFVQESITKGLEYSQKAFDLAKESHLDEYSAWAYLGMARGYRSNGESDKALNCNNMALSIVSTIDNDSLKTYVYYSLAKTYLARNDKLLAFRNALNALGIAEATGNYDLLELSYTLMSDFYRSLSDFEKAKDYQFKKAALQQQQSRPYDLLDTYESIGDLYSLQKEFNLSQQYFQKTNSLTDSLHYGQFKIQIYNGLLNLYISTGRYNEGIAYFNTHSEMKDFLNQVGMGYFMDYVYGILYVLANRPDSAAIYLKKSEPYIIANANKSNQYFFYAMASSYYQEIKNYDKAITYALKAKATAEQLGSLINMQESVTNLDTLYQLKGDYKTAYSYNSLYHQYGDSLNALAKERDMMSLEIDNENRRKDREAKLHEEEVRRSHNIQYMGITVAIACIFILLVGLGVFKVSKSTIEALGFFAFIFLFEFIILIADNTIHELTHGEPWKVLAIKIGLIAILLPLHHKLEHRVIHYLTTQELLHLKGKGILGKWRKKKDADLPMGNL